MKRLTKLYCELGLDVFFVIFSLVMIYISLIPSTIITVSGKDMGPMIFPRAVLILLALLMLLDIKRIVSKIVKDGENNNEIEKSILNKPVMLTLIIILLYVALWNILGFTLSTVIFLSLETKIVNSNIPTKNAVLVAVFASIILYIVFALLFKMKFPEPLLENFI